MLHQILFILSTLFLFTDVAAWSTKWPRATPAVVIAAAAILHYAVLPKHPGIISAVLIFFVASNMRYWFETTHVTTQRNGTDCVNMLKLVPAHCAVFVGAREISWRRMVYGCIYDRRPWINLPRCVCLDTQQRKETTITDGCCNSGWNGMQT